MHQTPKPSYIDIYIDAMMSPVVTKILVAGGLLNLGLSLALLVGDLPKPQLEPWRHLLAATLSLLVALDHRRRVQNRNL